MKENLNGVGDFLRSLIVDCQPNRMTINAFLKGALCQIVTFVNNYGLTVRKPSDGSRTEPTRVRVTKRDQKSFPASFFIKCFYPYK